MPGKRLTKAYRTCTDKMTASSDLSLQPQITQNIHLLLCTLYQNDDDTRCGQGTLVIASPLEVRCIVGAVSTYLDGTIPGSTILAVLRRYLPSLTVQQPRLRTLASRSLLWGSGGGPPLGEKRKEEEKKEEQGGEEMLND